MLKRNGIPTAAQFRDLTDDWINTKLTVNGLRLAYELQPGNGQAAKQYYNSRTVKLPHPSSSTTELVNYAQAALKSIYKFGYQYQKVGVIMSNLVPADLQQQDLFTVALTGD